MGLYNKSPQLVCACVVWVDGWRVTACVTAQLANASTFTHMVAVNQIQIILNQHQSTRIYAMKYADERYREHIHE